MIDLSLVLLFIFGMVSVVLNTAVGGGGGLLLVPLLILIFDQSANAAIATSFMVTSVGGFAAILAYSRQGRVDYRVGLLLAALALAGVVAGAFIASSLPASLFNLILGTVTLPPSHSAVHEAAGNTKIARKEWLGQKCNGFFWY